MKQRTKAEQLLVQYPSGVYGELDQAIYRRLCQGAHTSRDLQRVLERPRTSVRWALRRLMRLGLVRDFWAPYESINGLMRGVTYISRSLHFFALGDHQYKSIRRGVDPSITNVTLKLRAIADRNRVHSMLASHENGVKLRNARKSEEC